MDAYSELDAIYFSVGNKTSYAKYVPKLIDEVIETGTYEGSPPYKPINKPLPKMLKQYHAAEHQVYNCFLKKARDLAKEAQLNEFKDYIPELTEAKRTTSFSLMCGTTLGFSTGIFLIASAIPYFFKLNTHIGFMLIWLAFIIAVTVIITYLIQKKFYLAQAEDRHLILAIEALKEVLKDERDHTT